jgi:Leucine-rich repeat (LRR) protein
MNKLAEIKKKKKLELEQQERERLEKIEKEKEGLYGEVEKLELEKKDIYDLAQFELKFYKNLKNLVLSNNKISKLEETVFGNMTLLENLNLFSNEITELPKDFVNLSSLTNLNLGKR